MSGEHGSLTVSGMLLDDQRTLSLEELCRVTSMRSAVIIEMVEEGVLEPRGQLPEQWRFPASALGRLHAALRLQQHLGVNLAGAALALELLDELHSLRRRTRALEAMVVAEPFDER